MDSVRWTYGKVQGLFHYIVNWRTKEDDEGETSEPQDCPRAAGTKQQRAFSGTITSVLEAEVVVNGCITVDRLLLQEPPSCGMVLRGMATRATAMDHWTAVSLEKDERPGEAAPSTVDGDAEEMWDDVVSERIQARLHPNGQPLPKRMIGMVTAFSHNCGVLNNEISFPVSACEPGYRVCVGDWVLAHLNSPATQSVMDQGVQQQVHRITPHRKIGFRGQVTSMQRNFGIVDKKIVFNLRFCHCNFRPRIGDFVEGVCMESVQIRDCSFRALSVKRSDRQPSTAGEFDFGTFPLLNNMQSSETDPHEVEDGQPAVQVTPDGLDFGKTRIGKNLSRSITINNVSVAPVQLTNVSISNVHNDQFSVDVHEFPVTLEPASTLLVNVTFSPALPGYDQQSLLIEVDDKTVKVLFLRGTVTDQLEQQVRGAERRFAGRGRGLLRQNPNFNPRDDYVMPGVRPVFADQPKQLLYRLKPYAPPTQLRELLSKNNSSAQNNPSKLMDIKASLERMYPSICKPEITMDDYVTRWAPLLYMEELQEEINIRQYDLENAAFVRKGEYLCTKIPGLQENRPSIIVGDRVIVKQLRDTDIPRKGMDAFEGFVHDLKRDEAYFMFHRSFHQNFSPDNSYLLQFTVNRTPYRRMHQAVEIAVKSLRQDILFPSLDPAAPLKASQCPKASLPTYSKEEFFNKTLNTEQKSAVMRVLNGRARPKPYVIFGPPGTGKTTTLVEVILQIYVRLPFSRMLVAAPSNYAADLLCERLADSGVFGEGDIVRLLAISRDRTLVSERIRHLCMTRENMSSAAMHRLVISTCVSSGLLHFLRLPPGHFTHIVIDEAGQATEPECLIPMSVLSEPNGQIILAGDPFQLGPVISSRWAVRYGLQRSFLERVLHLPSYKRQDSGYNPLLVTKLVKNYRAHPAIIEPYSQLFYDNELEACANEQVISQLLNWEYLQKKGFPVCFIGIRGTECRDPDSPSFFNPTEAVEAVRAAGRLLSCGLSSPEVGIITPYRKQVEKIRELLTNTSGADSIAVGSVEEFQGQERIAVIISTVRSDEQRHASFGSMQSMGFLTNPKRFNVAISRAQAALVVIGNPFILCDDPRWQHFLRYVVVNGGYRGCDLGDLIQTPQFASPPRDSCSSSLKA